LLVVDVDALPSHDGREAWAGLGIPEDGALLSYTPRGGKHLVWTQPNGRTLGNSAGNLPTGCDVRGAGGYIVVEPSIFEGRQYAWEVTRHPFDGHKPGPPPPTLLELLRSNAKGTKAAAPPVEGTIPEGTRNQALTSLAGTMRNRGMTGAEIDAALQAVNATRCVPPFPAADVTKIATWAGTKDAGAIAPYHPTDLGNAERLLAAHGDDLRFCPTWGAWLTWDGMRWAVDDLQEVARRAIAVARALYTEAGQRTDQAERAALGAWALKCESDQRRRAMIRTAEALTAIRPQVLDRDPWLLTTGNGTVDLRTGELLPHRRADLATKLAPVTYDPDATAPTWEAFLERIMAGNDELIGFLQRAAGYSLTGDIREQCMMILYGSGANGKTTLLETLAAMMGDYATKTPTETLLVKRGDTIPADVARLRGARLVTAVEAEEGQRLAESLVKQMTGGDTLTARKLYGDFFEFHPTFKLWLGSNHKPAIRGTDLAIWRRIRLVPFGVTIPEPEQDKTLPDKLRGELPGILAWAVRGCLDWQRHGLRAPAPVLAATAQYRGEQDVLGTWLDDCCVLGANNQAPAGALYASYRTWTDERGERTECGTVFARRLAERGFDKYRAGKGIMYIGLGLLTSDDGPVPV
jgi:putative DNA primase/helicase